MTPRPADTKPRTVGKVAIGLSAFAALVLLMSLWSVLSTVFVPSAASQRDQEKANATVEKYKAGFSGYIAQLDGRSLFFAPKQPVKDDAPVVVESTGPHETPKPTSYGGPRIIGMVNDFVWFDDGTRRKIGAEKEDDLAVKAVIAPWEAVVEWKGVEFTIGFFSRDGLIIPKKDESTHAEIVSTTAAATPPTPKEPAPDTDKPAPISPDAPAPTPDPKPASSPPPVDATATPVPAPATPGPK